MSGYVEYDSNNSGGSWWLSDDDWRALEAAGWKVAWASLEFLYTDDYRAYVLDDDGTPKLVPIGEGNSRCGFSDARVDENGDYRSLGALARRAYKPNCTDIRAAADEWERITGKSALDAGCPCCGQPHTFTAYDADGTHLESGPDADYSCDWS